MAYQRVLMPVDGSPHSLLAVSHAIKLAAPDGEVIVLTVAPEVPNTIGGSTHKELVREEHDWAEGVINPICDQVRAAHIGCVKVVKTSNHPDQAILYVAKEYKVDVIVMGSRGRSTLEELVLGSVAHHVVSQTALPVMVVG